MGYSSWKCRVGHDRVSDTEKSALHVVLVSTAQQQQRRGFAVSTFASLLLPQEARTRCWLQGHSELHTDGVF